MGYKYARSMWRLNDGIKLRLNSASNWLLLQRWNTKFTKYANCVVVFNMAIHSNKWNLKGLLFDCRVRYADHGFLTSDAHLSVTRSQYVGQDNHNGATHLKFHLHIWKTILYDIWHGACSFVSIYVSRCGKLNTNRWDGWHSKRLVNRQPLRGISISPII